MDRGVDGGLLSAPKGQQEAGEEKEEDRSLLIDIQQTVTYCPHYQQGCFHWVMLADTQESLLFCCGNSCETPVATVRLFAPACVFICAHMRVSLMFSFLCALNQRFIQSSALSVLSFANPLALFSSPSCHVNSKSGSNAILPLDPATVLSSTS